MLVTIKNHSHEELRLVTRIDTSAPGCIVKDDPPEPEVIGPMQEMAIVGLQPGVSYVIEQVVRRVIPHRFLQPGGDPYNRTGSKAFA